MFCDAWEENARVATQIVMHARDCRGGKGERKAVIAALVFLRQSKPLTYAANIEHLVGTLGRWRDLLDLAEMADAKLEGARLSGKTDLIELEILANRLSKDSALLAKGSAEHARDDGGDAKVVEGASTQTRSISLAAKWAPTEGGRFDKYAGRLSKILFPGDPKRKAKYRRMVSRLRKHLNLVESMLCSRKFDRIEFSKVPSQAHLMYNKTFLKRSRERYQAYLENVRSGASKIQSTTLDPHQLVKHFYNSHDSKQNPTIEALWKSLVDDLRKEGCLRDAIALSDVSGSMEGVPMMVSIALGILVAQLTAEPFRGRLLTFSKNPTWHKVPVDTGSLETMVQSVKGAEWGFNTNISKVFRLILDVAIESKISQANMPKTLFIFTDMQFDEASNDNQQTVYSDAKRRFAAAGYALPKIVFWNIRAGSRSAFPVSKNTPGVAMVSGFSSHLLKQFCKGDVQIQTPEQVMLDAVGKYDVAIVPSEINAQWDMKKPSLAEKQL